MTLNNAMSPVYRFMYGDGSRDKAVSRLEYCRSVYGDDGVAEWLDEYGATLEASVSGEEVYVTIVRDNSDTTLFSNRIELFLYF